MNRNRLSMIVAVLCVLSAAGARSSCAEAVEDAVLTYAPQVPPAITRRTPAVVRVKLETKEIEDTLMEGLDKPTTFEFWTFNGHVPGPFIRVREGDTLELSLTNGADSNMPHNIDLHAVTGPGGGAPLTLAQPGKTRTARFKMLNAGLYVYHCAASPVTNHIANGMYGLILVEPAKGLPKVDREFYVLQSEFYTKQEKGAEGLVTYDRQKALDENPTYVVFNGRVGALMEGGALKAKVGETVRFYFGNAGPNKTSAFHVIGTIFERVYREGAIVDPPSHNIQTTLVGPGGSAVVEMKLKVPGNYTLVDHAIFRLEKGAVGMLKVEGPESPDIYREVK
jgi:nitrite reductase (NO-forming)